MANLPGAGGIGGEGVGFQLFTQSDNNPGTYVDATARDAYFSVNQSEVDRLAENEFLIIKLLDDGAGEVAYQQYNGPTGSYVPANWLNVTSLVQGESGEDSVDVSGLSEGDAVKWSNGVQKLIKGDARVDNSNKQWMFDESINVPPASVNIGTNIKVSDFGELVSLRNLATDINQVANGGAEIESEGILPPLVPTSPPSEQLAVQPITTDLGPVFDQNNPLTFILDPSVFTSSVPSDEFLILENIVELAQVPDGGQVRVQNFIGTDDTGHKIFDFVFDVSVGLFSFKPPAPQVFRSGVTYFVKSTPIGPGNYQVRGLQVGPDFFDNADIRGYPIQRSALIMRSDMGNSPDNYHRLNDEYTTASGVTGGIVQNYLPTATSDTMTGGQFTPGDPGISNPTMETDGAATFAQDDIILITDTNFNNGLFEVESHAANLLTIRGVGTVVKIEDFTRDNFINGISNATITKVNVSVIRSDSSGDWEVGKGSTTPISFSPVGSGLGGGNHLGFFDANDVLYLDGTTATANSRNGHPIIKFPNGVTSSVVREMNLSSDYADGDVSIFIRGAAESATTGNVVLGIEIEFVEVGVTDIDSDSFASIQTGVLSVNATSGIRSEVEILLTKAQADNWIAGGRIRVRVSRIGGDASDTLLDVFDFTDVLMEQ